MADRTVTRTLSVIINGKQVENSLTGIRAAIASTNRSLNGLDSTSADYNENLQRQQGILRELTERQSELREEIYGTNEEMDAAKSAWENLFSGLASGNLTQAAAGLSAIRAGIVATTRSALAFIATPIGLAITALAGIALATREWYNYNKEVAKANQETAAITKLSGSELDKARIQAQTLVKTFDVDFNEVLSTASTLVSEFGISYDEAFKRIENGLIKGGAANDEFLESMREYPTFFAQAGYSAIEFQNLINTGIDLSIYQDKLPDAIKEFALSITEQTPAVRDALTNAFGPEFTNTLLAGVKSGSITVKEALIQISDEANRLGLNSQQAQQLTADLFRGAGEDAGGAIKIFEAVTKSLENQTRPLSELEQGMQALAQSERDLAQTQDDALKSDGFAIWSNNVSIFINEVKSGFYDLIAVITNSREELDKISTKRGNDEWAKMSLDSFKDYIARRKKTLGDLYNFEKVQEEYLETVRQQQSNARTKDERDKMQAEIDIVTQYREKVSAVNNKYNINDINAKKKAADAKLKEIQKAADKEIAENRRVMDAWADAYFKAEAEINDLIAKSQSDRSVGQLKGLAKEIAQAEAKWAELRIKYKDHVDRLAEIDAAKNAEVQALKAAKVLEYGVQIDEINAQLDRDREAMQLDKAADEATSAEEKQAILIEKARMLADWEIQTELDKELAKVENVENAEALKQAIRDKYALKKASNDKKFDEAETNIRRTQVKWTEMTEEQKLSAVKGSLNGAAEAFNKGSNAWKAIKVAETAITTYQAAMNSYNSLSQIPVVGPALGAVAAALAVATGLKQIQQIQKTKIEKAPKFFKGGHTGNKAIGYDEFGTVTGYVHDDEWVAPKSMTRNKRYANVLGWLENERQKMNGYFSGGNTTAGDDAPVQIMDGGSSSGSDIKTVLMAILFRLENPVAPVLNIGYKDVKNLNTLNDDLSQSTRNGTLNS